MEIRSEKIEQDETDFVSSSFVREEKLIMQTTYGFIAIIVVAFVSLFILVVWLAYKDNGSSFLNEDNLPKVIATPLGEVINKKTPDISSLVTKNNNEGQEGNKPTNISNNTGNINNITDGVNKINAEVINRIESQTSEENKSSTNSLLRNNMNSYGNSDGDVKKLNEKKEKATKATDVNEKDIIHAVPILKSNKDGIDALLQKQQTNISSSSGSYLVQIGSFTSQSDANVAWGKFVKKHKVLLLDQTSDTQRIDLGVKGIYYRLRVASFQSTIAAKSFCNALKKRGTDCLIVKRK